MPSTALMPPSSATQETTTMSPMWECSGLQEPKCWSQLFPHAIAGSVTRLLVNQGSSGMSSSQSCRTNHWTLEVQPQSMLGPAAGIGPNSRHCRHPCVFSDLLTLRDKPSMDKLLCHVHQSDDLLDMEINVLNRFDGLQPSRAPSGTI